MNIDLSFLEQQIKETKTLYLNKLNLEILHPSDRQYIVDIYNYKPTKVYLVTEERLKIFELKCKLNKLTEQYERIRNNNINGNS